MDVPGRSSSKSILCAHLIEAVEDATGRLVYAGDDDYPRFRRESLQQNHDPRSGSGVESTRRLIYWEEYTCCWEDSDKFTLPSAAIHVTPLDVRRVKCAGG